MASLLQFFQKKKSGQQWRAAGVTINAHSITSSLLAGKLDSKLAGVSVLV